MANRTRKILKMTEPYRRKRKSSSQIIDAKFEAQKLAFAPLAFQAAKALRDLGILQELYQAGDHGVTVAELVKLVNLSEYAITTLLEVGISSNLVSTNASSRFIIGKVGDFILNDKMTRINMNFVNDVCYNGAFYLEQSLKDGKPHGLQTFGKWDTLYQALAILPENVQKSWFEFDHYYSDLVFPHALPIVFNKNPKHIFDLGGNTGKWAMECLKYNQDVKITILDLPGQLSKAKENLKISGYDTRCELYAIDILDKNNKLPKDIDVLWMSQFLDCFSKEQIIYILSKIRQEAGKHCQIYILEPFWDRQQFKAAAYSLNHTSLYFTCIANGNSKMYSYSDMKECIEKAGLKIQTEYHNLGDNQYSLLHCCI